MTIQRLLYNQLNKAYLYDDAQNVLVFHTPGEIQTNTSAKKLSLNIYSKLIAYAGGKACIEDLKSEGIDAQWKEVDNRKEGLISSAREKNASTIIVMDSCESYVSDRLHVLKEELGSHGILLDIRPNQQFLIDTKTFQEKYENPPIMETFYRWMRKSTGVLMEGEKPVGGKWNYDKENRKFDKNFIDTPYKIFGKNTFWNEALDYYQDDIQQRGKEVMRYIPITRDEALQLLDYFVTHTIDRFGELEDAMYTSSDFVHHSLLSIPLNFGLLSPQEVIAAVEKTDTAINNKEGFIRQVLGRREYMYHRFSFYKDAIYEQNFFGFEKELPDRFWRPEKSTLKMNCVQGVIEKVDTLGYSHHIERLMIIGNFCLLVGYNPHSVNKRFREQYADAFERVVTPNVLGMSQYADGGKLATKPYVASANYVNKMSNSCKTCYYDPKEKYGEKACPLNFLYRKFLDENKEVFIKGRQSFILNHLKKIDMEKISQQSRDFIKSLEQE